MRVSGGSSGINTEDLKENVEVVNEDISEEGESVEDEVTSKEDEEGVIDELEKEDGSIGSDSKDSNSGKGKKKWIIGVILLLIIVVVGVLVFSKGNNEGGSKGVLSSVKISKYDEYIEKGDEYLKNGYEYKARTCYNKARKEDREKSEAYYKLLNVYIDSVETDKIESIIEHIDRFVSEPSSELKSLTDEWRDRNWYVLEAITVNTEGKEICKGTFEYDDKGRVVKDNIGSICKTEYGPSNDNYYTYEYLEDNKVLMTKHYKDGSDGPYKVWIYELNDDGTPFCTEGFNAYGELSGETYYYSREGSRIYTGFYDRYYDVDYNENVNENGSYEYDNMYDANDTLVWRNRFDTHSYIEEVPEGDGHFREEYVSDGTDPDYVGETDYVYVYCKSSDLNGDLSKFPKANKELAKERAFEKLKKYVANVYGAGYKFEEWYSDDLEGETSYGAYKESPDEEGALYFVVRLDGFVEDDNDSIE